MTNGISSALMAYQQALSRIGGGAGTEAAKVSSPNNEFKNMVSESLSNAVELSKQAESVSLANISGRADIQDVVLAVSNAEMALETVVAVRDTAIKAYKEIMNMPM